MKSRGKIMADMAIAIAKTKKYDISDNIQCVPDLIEPVNYDNARIKPLKDVPHNCINDAVVIAQGTEGGTPIQIELDLETVQLRNLPEGDLSQNEDYSIIYELEIDPSNNVDLPSSTVLQNRMSYNKGSVEISSADKNIITNAFQIEEPLCLDNDKEIVIDVPIYGNMDEGRKRQRVVDSSNWRKNKNRKLRLEGKSYLGYSGKDGKVKQDTPRSERKLGPACTSSKCVMSKDRECQLFDEAHRKSIFDTFWSITDFTQRRIFVCSHTELKITKKIQTENDSRRKNSIFYYLPNDGGRKPVCKNMFLRTLSLGSYTVQSWVKSGKPKHNLSSSTLVANANKKDATSRRRNTSAKIVFLNSFFEKLPKLPSHYSRQNSSKLFLEHSFDSIQDVFNCYIQECQVQNELSVSITVFKQEMNIRNIALFTLRKDRCDTCWQYEIKQISLESYEDHLRKKNRAQEEKAEDKEMAKNGSCIVLTMDLQSVKVCPSLQVSAAYYKTKLTNHNFTVYNLQSLQATCYWFTEVDSELDASTFVSCIIDYLVRHCVGQNLPIIIYSDGCTYQNRNAVLSNGLLHFSKKYNVAVTQKFLEKGHTQMECDSVHSAIERKLKNKDIYLPYEYIQASRSARIKPEPYEVLSLDYTFFKDYTNNIVYKSIRSGRKAGDPVVTDLRCLHYESDIIQYKLDYDEAWKNLPIRPKAIKFTEPKQLNAKPIPLSLVKWRHLQELKAVIPKECHSFYDNLVYE